MSKKKNLIVLASVFVVICVVTLIVSNIQTKKEDIKTSGEEILSIDVNDVQTLEIATSKNTLNFTKQDDNWTYDEDNNFPIDNDKLNDLLDTFSSFNSTFVIENVEDYSLYGLDNPMMTITITTSLNTYIIKLGDESKMDEQRYISINGGDVYLAASDPYNTFNIEPSSLIKNDSIEDINDVSSIVFKGNENYTITKEDIKTLCEDDKYFVDNKPLDSDNIDSYISLINALSLTDYVTYNVTDSDLKEYGLDNPELTITINYDEDKTLNLYVSSNVEEKEEYDKQVEKGTDEDDLVDVTRYIRVEDSKIIYKLPENTYTSLTAVSYDALRHQLLFTGDSDSITSMDITLDGNDYTFIKEDDTWKLDEEEVELKTLISNIENLTATSFTEDTTSNNKEVSITLHLDNKDYPTFKIDIYRNDGTTCLVYVDDSPIAYVSRTSVVDLIEEINKIILK